MINAPVRKSDQIQVEGTKRDRGRPKITLVVVKKKGKTQVQFLRLGTLGSPIEFKHLVALTNEIQNNVIFSMNI